MYLTVSVIVPTRNRLDVLRQAVAALCAQQYPRDGFEIVVVDNASSDGTATWLESIVAERGPRVRWLREAKPGSHYARNRGFAAATGQIVALIDDDIVVAPDWLERLVAVYQNPQVGCAGGRIRIKWINGRPDSHITPFSSRLGELDLGEETAFVESVNAGNLSARRDVLIRVGGYNPCNAPGDSLVGDGEAGLCRKVRRAGYAIMYVPAATAWHLQDASRVTVPYLKRRFADQGRSDAYTDYQCGGGSTAALAYRTLRAALRAAEAWHSQWSRSDGANVQNRLMAAYWGGRTTYYSRLTRSPKFRRLVRREDWISELLHADTPDLRS